MSMDTPVSSSILLLVLAVAPLAVVVHSAMVAYGNRKRSKGATNFFAVVSLAALALTLESLFGSGHFKSQMYGLAIAYASFLVWIHFLSDDKPAMPLQESRAHVPVTEEVAHFDQGHYLDPKLEDRNPDPYGKGWSQESADNSELDPKVESSIADTYNDPAWAGTSGNIYSLEK